MTHTVIAHGIDIAPSSGRGISQRPQTVDVAILHRQVVARLTRPVDRVRRRSRLEQTPHHVAAVGQDTQMQWRLLR